MPILLSSCQNMDSNDNIIKEPPYIPLDQLCIPTLTGGDSAYHHFIDKNINQEKLKKVKKVGVVWVKVLFDANGKPTDFIIFKSLDSLADNEFLRVLKMMPNWEPAMKNKKPVPSSIILPLRLPYSYK